MPQQKMSVSEYLISNGRELPFGDCYMNKSAIPIGMVTVIVTKQMPSGNFILSAYLLDIYCLGLKSSLLSFDIDAKTKKFIVDSFSASSGKMEKTDIVYLHNLIYGAINYSRKLGFGPDKSFKNSEMILNPDLVDDGISKIEFGCNGKPMFIQGPDDNVNDILATLNKIVGKGNYDFTILGGNDFL
ncbi:MAG: hypothetical protein HY738_14685 [Bacteroidia bacterium]|nr:hypothetical protein [Bacteroidia bacterium]